MDINLRLALAGAQLRAGVDCARAWGCGIVAGAPGDPAHPRHGGGGGRDGGPDRAGAHGPQVDLEGGFDRVKVILTKDVEKLGRSGEMKTVADG